MILGDLVSKGYTIDDDDDDDGQGDGEDKANNVVIVNTCAFVEDAKNESLEAIFEAVQKKNEGRAKKVVITGCLAQRYAVSSLTSCLDMSLHATRFRWLVVGPGTPRS